MQEFVFDMETSDPDDVFALALLATHPRSKLVGVTIHPGGLDQVGVARHILDRLGCTGVPIGAGTPKSAKPRVSQFHYEWLGQVPECQPQGTATEVIRGVLDSYPHAHLVTGAALTNIAEALKILSPRFFIEWTCQGGFAGDNVVPPEHRLPKFAGKVTCPTFNLNGDPRAAKELLCGDSSPFWVRRLVSKNVCHGVFWTPEVNDRVPSGVHAGLDLIKEGMGHYFLRHPAGKALHDVIAAAAALSPTIGTWSKVHPYREHNGEWGCREVNELDVTLDASAPPEIMVTLDNDAFERTLAD